MGGEMIKLFTNLFKRKKTFPYQPKSGRLYKHCKTGDLYRCLMNGYMGANDVPVVILKNIHTEQIRVVLTYRFWKDYDEKK